MSLNQRWMTWLTMYHLLCIERSLCKDRAVIKSGIVCSERLCGSVCMTNLSFCIILFNLLDFMPLTFLLHSVKF